MQVVPLPSSPSPDAPLVETAHARAYLLPAGGDAPVGTDATVALPDGARFAYAPTARPDAAAGAPAQLAIDPFVRGNHFTPLHDSARALAALLGVAAARRVDTGPESERMFLVLRGAGLVFDQNGDTTRFEPHSVAIVPAGEPARLWAQGPEDVLAVVFQPKGAPVPRRTLAGEIAKRRQPE